MFEDCNFNDSDRNEIKEVIKNNVKIGRVEFIDIEYETEEAILEKELSYYRHGEYSRDEYDSVTEDGVQDLEINSININAYDNINDCFDLEVSYSAFVGGQKQTSTVDVEYASYDFTPENDVNESINDFRSLTEKLKREIISPDREFLYDDMEDESGMNVVECTGGIASTGVASSPGLGAVSAATVNGVPVAGRSVKRKKDKKLKIVDSKNESLTMNRIKRINEDLVKILGT